jgi:rubrerythrin
MGIFDPAFQEKGRVVSAERPESVTRTAEDYVRFRSAGESGKGRYQCAECAYGVTVCRSLPVCPSCSGRLWKRAAWSPFSRAPKLR